MLPNVKLARDLGEMQTAFFHGQFEGIRLRFTWDSIDYYIQSVSREREIGNLLVAVAVMKAYADLKGYSDKKVQSLAGTLRGLYGVLCTKRYDREWHILLLLWMGHVHRTVHENGRAQTLYFEAKKAAFELSEGPAKEKIEAMCELFLAWNQLDSGRHDLAQPSLRLALRGMRYHLRDPRIRSAHQLANTFLALIERRKDKKGAMLMYARAASRVRWTWRGRVHDLGSERQETAIIPDLVEPFSS